MPCNHDERFSGVWDLPEPAQGCLACAYEQLSAEGGEMRQAISTMIHNASNNPELPSEWVLKVLAKWSTASTQQERPGLGFYDDGMAKLGYRSGSVTDDSAQSGQECQHPDAHQNFGKIVCLGCQEHWALDDPLAPDIAAQSGQENNEGRQ